MLRVNSMKIQYFDYSTKPRNKYYVFLFTLLSGALGIELRKHLR